MKVAIIFDNFGPYHLARLRAAAAVTELLAVEVATTSAEYAWTSREPNGGLEDWKIVTLQAAGTSQPVSTAELQARINKVLDAFQPRVVFIPGWSSKAAFVALLWCIQNQIPAVAMSESTAWDEKRRMWREAVKRRIVGLFSTALVGGTPHKDYMIRLGMPAERVFLGYDAVDNDYFAQSANEVRSKKDELRRKLGLPEKYFLASARFIGKKNLPGLIAAYARYCALAGKAESGKRKAEMWDLVLIGDGALRPDLCRLISDLALQAFVHLPGFKQYSDLPAYYGCAQAFIHASTSEQWGLVVNEAMASGLPVLVSNCCGCAMSLVKDGLNGFTFDPYNMEQLAQLMLRVSCLELEAARSEVRDQSSTPLTLAQMGDASRAIISDWGSDRFAQGIKAAAEKAVAIGSKQAGWIDRLLLRGLLLR